MPHRRKAQPQAKLYRDLDRVDRWIAWSANTGWTAFWARPNGWANREPLVGLDAMRLREVTLPEAFNTDLLAAFQRAAPPALSDWPLP
jgi:hypothetical protein